MDVTVSDSISQAAFGYGLTIIVAVLTAGMIWLVVYILEHLHHRREAAAKAAMRLIPKGSGGGARRR